MGEETRATPMTLFTPVARWRAQLLRLTWFLTRLMLRFSPQVYPFGSLRKLAFIHFAHWSLVDRVPANSPNGRPLPHPYILFQTNFNRGWREYVEGFCLVVPTAMLLNWRFAYGFPSPRPVGPLLDYVECRFTTEAHFYCAYPDSSVRQVIAAVHERKHFNKFANTATEPPPRFRRKRSSERVGGPVLLGRSGQMTDTISVFTPLLADRERPLRDMLNALPQDEASPLSRVAGTHMARWSVVAPLPYKRTDKPIDSTWYLLYASWFSGNTERYLEQLRERLGDVADAVWGNCVGYPGSANEAAFVGYMMEHAVKPRLEFAGYRQPVRDIRASIELQDRLREPVVRQSGMSSGSLEQAWLRRHRHG